MDDADVGSAIGEKEHAAAPARQDQSRPMLPRLTDDDCHEYSTFHGAEHPHDSHGKRMTDRFTRQGLRRVDMYRLISRQNGGGTTRVQRGWGRESIQSRMQQLGRARPEGRRGELKFQEGAVHFFLLRQDEQVTGVSANLSWQVGSVN
jgi:hypothetical protein